MKPATATERFSEVSTKLKRVRALLDEADIDGFVFATQGGVAWLTAGLEDVIIRGADPGFVWVLVTREEATIFTTNIEGPRILVEEGIEALGFEVIQTPWTTDAWTAPINARCHAERLGNDGAGPGRSLATELSRLRVDLTEQEQERLREIGRDACVAVETAMCNLSPGATERVLAAEIAYGLELVGIVPSVLLVGSDDRRFRFRHPTISDQSIERTALAVLVGVRDGLNIALSRSVAFAGVEEHLLSRHEVAARVEAAEMAATRPGATWGEALEAGITAYAENGFPGEWRHHYQGGAVGYAPREFTPGPLEAPNAWTSVEVQVGNAGAWNPTVQGAKSEDTFIVGREGPELITNSDSWPSIAVDVGGLTLYRPSILILD